MLHELTDHAIAIPKPKRSMLPILTVLFLISYGLMAMLVVEQGRTIDSQRLLIRNLFSDSTQLSAMKGNAVMKHNAEAKAQAEAHARSQAQVPSSQDPLSRIPLAQAPSSQASSSQGPLSETPSAQATPQNGAKSDHQTGKLKKHAPLKPPKFTSDEADERRAAVSI